MATHRYRAVAPANIECRQAERLFVTVRRSTIEVEADVSVEAVLGDVSPFGCRLELAGGLMPGEALRLRIGGGMEIGAVVVWVEGGTIGCRFDKPMQRATVRSLTLRS